MKLPALLLAGATAVTASWLGYQQFSSGGGRPSSETLLAQGPAVEAPPTPAVPAAPKPAEPPAAAPAVPGGTPPEAAKRPDVDESALRYFARQGDQRRLNAEIARLKALFPGWTPPANPLEGASGGDPQLDRMWALYAEGKLAEVRKAIADRQKAEPNWQVPDDLMQRLAVAEAREQLVNASNLKQYETVIRVGSSNPSLLTCGEIDILWRVAEAFARTDRAERANDAYNYVLTNCDNPADRVSTMQKAMLVLPRPAMDALLSIEKNDEFAAVRDELARQALIEGNKDPKLTVAPADISRVEKLARDAGKPTDSLLLGWYYLRRDDIPAAEQWFRRARDKEDTASASQGLGLALIAQGRPAEAEEILFKWRDGSDQQRSTYLAAAANLLATDPPVAIPPNILARIVPSVVTAKDAATAQQLGWYAYILNQFDTAARWFEQALQWKPDDEPSAYGLAITAERLGDRATVAAIQRQWAGRSTRIAILGETRRERKLRRPQATLQRPALPPAEDGEAAPSALPTLQPYPLKPAETPVEPLPFQAVPDTQRFEPIPYQALEQGKAPAAELPPLQPARVIEDPLRPLAPDQSSVAPLEPAPTPMVAEALPARQAQSGGTRGGSMRNCASTINPDQLSPQAALNRGWCLMELNRPLEAAAAFESALRSNATGLRRDAAYGQSLAYLRAGLSDQAAVSAAKAPLDRKRGVELETSILEARASGAFEAGRYVEALLALDQRDAIATQRVDLMVMRGYAYMNLGQWGDARQVFQAVAATGNKEGARGLANLKAARHPRTD